MMDGIKTIIVYKTKDIHTTCKMRGSSLGNSIRHTIHITPPMNNPTKTDLIKINNKSKNIIFIFIRKGSYFFYTALMFLSLVLIYR